MNMVIVRLTGGLGNQMFQYAFYKSIHSKGHSALIDDFSFRKNHRHENLKITHVFPHVTYKKATPRQVHQLADVKFTVWEKAKKKIFGGKKTHIKSFDLLYHPIDDINIGDVYLDGYWQSEKYFRNIENEIRHDFRFAPLTNPKHINLVERIKSGNSVSIHVRKGKDFHSPSRKDICNAAYYRKAINAIREQVNDPQFYVFSDNINWCKENLDFIDPVYAGVNDPTGLDSYLDMQLMSNCKHNIIANSSYSWWGAWLNPNAEKMVMAPEKWFNENTVRYKVEDLVPESWRTI